MLFSIKTSLVDGTIVLTLENELMKVTYDGAESVVTLNRKSLAGSMLHRKSHAFIRKLITMIYFTEINLQNITPKFSVPEKLELGLIGDIYIPSIIKKSCQTETGREYHYLLKNFNGMTVKAI